MLNPEVARLRASRASNVRWANEPDRTAATAKMRAGFIEKLQRQARQQFGPNTTDDPAPARELHAAARWTTGT